MNHNSETINISSPILLAGLSRSGTTWVGKLLDSHPDVLYRHEPDTWCKDMLKSVPLICDHDEIDANIAPMKKFLDGISLINASKVAGKQPIFPKSYLSNRELLIYRAAVYASKVGSRFIKNFPAYTYSINGKKYRLVWKSIDALGRVNLLAKANPNVKILHLVRHPCGYVASIIRGSIKGRFESNVANYNDENLIRMLLGTPYALSQNLDLDLMLSLNSIERLAWIWVLFNEKARNDGENLSNYKFINYQKLCANPFNELELIYEHLGLNWNDQTEGFVKSSTTTNKDEYYGIVKDPLISSLKWQTELSKKEITSVLDIVCKSKIGQEFSPN